MGRYPRTGRGKRMAESYRSAVRSLATADALVRSEEQRRRQIDRSFRLGEVDRLAPLTAQQEQAVVALARFEALVQQREAMAAIEDAAQRSIFDTTGPLFLQFAARPPND